MKFVKLLGHAYVNGALRSPAEGVLHLTNEEADRLIGENLGEDVTADFDAIETEDVPVEHITAEPAKAPASKEKGK